MNKPLRSSKNYSYCKPTSVLFSESAMPNFFETEKKTLQQNMGEKKLLFGLQIRILISIPECTGT